MSDNSDLSKMPEGAKPAKFGPTPGPWKIHPRFYLAVVGADGETLVANCGSRTSNVNVDALHGEQEANARLIAAAPDLLTAVKACIRSIASMGLDLEVSATYADQIRRLNALVSKATGEA